MSVVHLNRSQINEGALQQNRVFTSLLVSKSAPLKRSHFAILWFMPAVLTGNGRGCLSSGSDEFVAAPG
jgi:hypothetical protein